MNPRKPAPHRPTTSRAPRRTAPGRTTAVSAGGTATRGAQDRNRFGRQVSAGRLIVPSALTILAICAGLTAVRSAAAGHIDLALALVVAAALLDGLDGRVARLIGATTRLGAEIDSLADAINFGVVPALIVYLHLVNDRDLGWAFALVYCCAIVLRLARFNTLLDDDDRPGYTRDFFVGVPAPAAAIIALGPVGLERQFGGGWWTSLPAVGAWLVIVALLAVSRVPTASLKVAKVPPRAVAGVLILVAIAAAMLLTFPYLLMLVAIAGYLAHIPFAWRSQHWVASRPEHWDDLPAERRAQRRALARTGGRRRLPVRGKSQARLGLRRPAPPTDPAARPDPAAPGPRDSAPTVLEDRP